jgi:hypothetical protein
VAEAVPDVPPLGGCGRRQVRASDDATEVGLFGPQVVEQRAYVGGDDDLLWSDVNRR